MMPQRCAPAAARMALCRLAFMASTPYRSRVSTLPYGSYLQRAQQVAYQCSVQEHGQQGVYKAHGRARETARARADSNPLPAGAASQRSMSLPVRLELGVVDHGAIAWHTPTSLQTHTHTHT